MFKIYRWKVGLLSVLENNLYSTVLRLPPVSLHRPHFPHRHPLRLLIKEMKFGPDDALAGLEVLELLLLDLLVLPRPGLVLRDLRDKILNLQGLHVL